MKKILIVGGQESFTKTWAKQHLPNVGLEMVWLWNYERRKFPSFPKSADGVILLKEMCGHLHRNKAIKEAKRWGIPFAEVSRQWLRALPILEEKGIVSPSQPLSDLKENSPVKKNQTAIDTEAQHPDWEEYLDILLLEYDIPNIIEITQRLSELIKPYPMTDEVGVAIRVKANRKLITNDNPKPPPPKESSVTVYFTNSMNRAYNIACSLTHSESTSVINFVTKCSKKAKPNVPSSVRNIFLANKVDNPTVFSGVLYHIFNDNNCTTTAELINKAYERVLGRKHNYTKPREVFSHYSCEWVAHDVSAITDQKKKELQEAFESVQAPQVTQPQSDFVQAQMTHLSDEMSVLTDMVKQLAEQNQLLTQQIVELTNHSRQKPTKGDNVVIPKSELIEYIINNKLNITIK